MKMNNVTPSFSRVSNEECTLYVHTYVFKIMIEAHYDRAGLLELE